MRTIIIRIAFLAVATLLFTSCDNFYFHKPQPVGEKNLEEFPKAYRGMWGEEMDTTIIAEDHVLIITKMKRKVERQKVEESNQYKFVDDLVFVMSNQEGEAISNGQPYYWDADTLVIEEREVMEIDLGKKTFLRNTANGHLFNRKDENNWWEVYYLEKAQNGEVVVRMLQKDDLEILPGVQKVHEKDGQYYLKAEWTKADFEEVLRRGGFSDTVVVLEQEYRID